MEVLRWTVIGENGSGSQVAMLLYILRELNFILMQTFCFLSLRKKYGYHVRKNQKIYRLGSAVFHLKWHGSYIRCFQLFTLLLIALMRADVRLADFTTEPRIRKSNL